MMKSVEYILGIGLSMYKFPIHKKDVKPHQSAHTSEDGDEIILHGYLDDTPYTPYVQVLGVIDYTYCPNCASIMPNKENQVCLSCGFRI